MAPAEFELEIDNTQNNSQAQRPHGGEDSDPLRPHHPDSTKDLQPGISGRIRRTDQSSAKSSNDSREIRCKPIQDELAQKALPQDPSSRVSGLLSEISKYFANSTRNLPAEARRLQQCSNLGHLLTGLDLLLDDHVLDLYLEENPMCLHLVRLLFSCRHHYLLCSVLKVEDDENACKTAADAAAQTQGSNVFVPQVGPLCEAFKSNSAGSQFPCKKVVWMPECSPIPSKTLKDVTPAGNVQDCIDAYDNFEPVTAWEEWAQSFDPQQMHVSPAELEVSRKIFALRQLVAHPTIETLKAAVSAMPKEFRSLLYGSKADKAIIEDLRDRIWANKMANRIKTEGSIELTLDFDCPAPLEEDMPPQHAGVTKAMALLALAKANKQATGISTVEEFGRYHYKGSTIPLPQVLLPWAINFLADEDADRTVGWAERFAELTEYLAHLHHNYAFEDWGHQMREAVGMLKTHWTFESYYYGPRELRLEFPVNMWPKESRRLPRLPGPDVELRRESDDQRDLKGPRLLLHQDVMGAHDQQYETPTDVLKRCYLRPYRADFLTMWESESSATSEPENLAHLENRYFEACMGKGIVQVAKFLDSKIGRFRYSPEDISQQGARKPAERTSLESFAMFRGAKRAALQHCLNVFDSAENRQMCTAWRTLNLPASPQKQKPDAGIIFSSHMIKDAPPEKDSQDPWAYTRAHRRYRKEEASWAAWTRDHTLKTAWKLKLGKAGGGPIMELPKTWKGLYSPDVMDVEMKRRYELLRRCEIIKQSLKRAARRAPRPFIIDLVDMYHAGLQGKELQGLDLNFAAHEFSVEDAHELALVRPTEAAWLEYICQPSRNRPIEPSEPLSRIGVILISRVQDMLKDISPCSLFRDMEPKSMDEFLGGLNAVKRGPVKRHEFTRAEVTNLATSLHFMKVLRVYRQRQELQFARPETDFHPEDLIVWPGADEQEDETANDEERRESPDAADRRSLALSGSTDLTMPASIDDFLEYPEHMPRKKDVLSLEEHILNPTSNSADQERTHNFFRCLSYRLGVSLRGLRAIRKQDVKTIRDPARQEQNANFQGEMIDIWSEDTKTRPNNPSKNPRKIGTHRETLTLPDVVKMADPKNFEEDWVVGQWPDESAARAVVRKNLIRELCENKTMIWPVQLPYDRRTMEYKLPNPNPPLPLPDEYVGKEKSVLRREPIWTFGHPSRKPRAHLFWDMNNWPLNTLSREIRERVQSRGPKKQDDQESQNDTYRRELSLSSKPHQISYRKKAEEKRVFVPGPAEYWAGDTPLQRKMVEQRIRQRFERRKPQKRGWTECIADVFFGGDKAKLDGDFTLPEVDPASIPESRPAKRPRLNESFESVSSSQDPLLAVGPSSSFTSSSGLPVGGKAKAVMDEGLTVTGTDNVVLKYEGPDSAKTMKLVGRFNIKKGRASVTYWLPDGGDKDDDPPLILYYKPVVPAEA